MKHVLTHRTWKTRLKWLYNSFFGGEKYNIVLSIGPILIKSLDVPVPALQEDGGSLCKSLNSFRILLDAIEANTLQGEEEVNWRGTGCDESNGKVVVFIMEEFEVVATGDAEEGKQMWEIG